MSEIVWFLFSPLPTWVSGNVHEEARRWKAMLQGVGESDGPQDTHKLFVKRSTGGFWREEVE